MSLITFCLLNWKRPRHLTRILDCLSAQTLRPVVFLFNNSPRKFYHPAIDWQVDSSRNMLCLPRWWMATHAETPFVASLDDDLLPLDSTVVADIMAVAEKQPLDCVIGSHGAILPPGKKYIAHVAVSCPNKDTVVDLIKGRCLIVRRETLAERVRLGVSDSLAKNEDDIAICGSLAAGRRGYHLVPSLFHGRMRDLPQGAESLWHRKDHQERRNAAFERWFSCELHSGQSGEQYTSAKESTGS